MSWYTIRRRATLAAAAAAAVAGAAAAAASSAEVWIYGDIGESWWGESVDARTFNRQLAELDVDEIDLRINSYGGSVSDGIAIYNALKRHRATVNVTVDGIAASIASLIAMAGDRVEVASNAMLMLHAPWTGAYGNAVELREVADRLDAWAASMASAYVAKTGKSTEDVMAWLTDGADHYFNAEEAVAAGLADAVVAATPAATASSRFTWAAADPGALPAPTHPRAPALQRNPAAAAAHHQEHTMPNPIPAATQPNAATTADVQAAIRAEAQRQADIRAAFKPHQAALGDDAAKLLDECLADIACDVTAAKAKLLDVKAKGIEPVAGHHVVTLEDQRDKQRAGLRSALEMRAGLAKHDTANPFRGHSLIEMARMCLATAGVRDVPGDRAGLVGMAFAHTTSDFPLLLSNVAQKAMMKGYEEADETFQLWTTAGSLPDFKVASLLDIGSVPSLRKKAEGAEYKYITVGERREQRVLATYGEMFRITREAVINDDLGAFSRLPRKMGRAAIRTVGDLVYAVLTANAAMADGTALFHADHANLLDAATPSTASVDAMRVKMARQKGLGQTTGSLNIRMRYLIAPVTLQGIANQVRDAEYEVGASTKNNTVPNYVRGSFEVVTDARLDDASTSVWYGAADPALHDTVIVDYLDGVQTPTLEQQGMWTTDGVEMKVRMDAAAKALDWKTLARNG